MKINDHDLEFLKVCSNAQLAPLLDALLGKDHQGRISSELELNEAFIKNYPNHRVYVDVMIEELQKYGGNTIMNWFRGSGVSYREILIGVCRALKVNFNKRQGTSVIEEHLLAKVLEDIAEKMTPAQLEALCLEVGSKAHGYGGAASEILLAAFKAGGFSSYKLTLVIVNWVWKLIFKKGLSLAANKSICKFLSFMSGPVGWIACTAWSVYDVASPAMRVCVPACIYIAALRRINKAEADMQFVPQ